MKGLIAHIVSKLSPKFFFIIGLDLIRVDLYDTGTKIYFGEMTLTPAGAIFHNWSQKALDDMGSFYYKTMKK